MASFHWCFHLPLLSLTVRQVWDFCKVDSSVVWYWWQPCLPTSMVSFAPWWYQSSGKWFFRRLNEIFLTVRVSRTVLQVWKLFFLLGLYSKWLLTSQWLLMSQYNFYFLKSLKTSQKVSKSPKRLKTSPKISKSPKSLKRSPKDSKGPKSFKKFQNVSNLTVKHWKPFQSRF